MKTEIFKNEKVRVILFYAVLTVILTWPVAWHFFSSVPSLGSDTMQVIGVAGERVNVLKDNGFFGGTLELAKRSEFNIVTIYAYFEIIFGRVAGYNLLFFLSFVLSGFGMYLLAFYFTRSKPASLIAGIIFAFSPFHVHNSLSTNVGTMHQEWLPFFALYLFKFFDPVRNYDNSSKNIDANISNGRISGPSEISNGAGNLKVKYFFLAGLFLAIIAFTEHQLLAFSLIFVLFFLVYKIFTQPKVFLRKKFWIYAVVGALVLSLVFFFMFRSLFKIASSENNYLTPGFKAAVKYSNDTLSVFIPPSFHAFWPDAFAKLRGTFERKIESSFSVYVGFLVLALSIFAFFKDRISKKWFWLAVALGFYVLSLGPYLHFKGQIEPPVKMPYLLTYNYLPFFNNIRTVGRLFVYSMLAFSVLAAWGAAYLISKKRNKSEKIKEEVLNENKEEKELAYLFGNNLGQKIIFFAISIIIVIEYLAVPIKTNLLLHSSFYEKLGQDKENYSVLEVPGSTDYDFASRDLVWKSIHRKNTVNGYDFARVIDDHYTFQRGTPIIRTILYDLPGGSNGNDRDMMKDSYYDISSEILNYYNIRYIILDKEGLKGNPAKGDLNMFYSAQAYVQNVIKCADEYQDEYLYACKIDVGEKPNHMFLAMDYSNNHWVGKSKSKNGLHRWAENGAGVKLVNMTGAVQSGEMNFNLKVAKPLRAKVFLNGNEVYNKYITSINQKQAISVDLSDIQPGENDITFGVFAADGTEIRSDKKSDTIVVYQLSIDQ